MPSRKKSIFDTGTRPSRTNSGASTTIMCAVRNASRRSRPLVRQTRNLTNFPSKRSCCRSGSSYSATPVLTLFVEKFLLQVGRQCEHLLKIQFLIDFARNIAPRSSHLSTLPGREEPLFFGQQAINLRHHYQGVLRDRSQLRLARRADTSVLSSGVP